MALLQPPLSERSVTVSVSLRSPAVLLVAFRLQVTLGAPLALRITRTSWLHRAIFPRQLPGDHPGWRG